MSKVNKCITGIAHRGGDVGVAVPVAAHPGAEVEGGRADGQLAPSVLL
jgi:hypothetical protein